MSDIKPSYKFPFCIFDPVKREVPIGDDGLPFFVTRDKISDWWWDSEMPKELLSLSDEDLINKSFEQFRKQNNQESLIPILYSDALQFSKLKPDFIEDPYSWIDKKHYGDEGVYQMAIEFLGKHRKSVDHAAQESESA